MGDVTEGRFTAGMHYLKVGQGPPLLAATGLTPEHVNPTGLSRRMSLAWAAPYAEHFTVYLTSRRPALEPGTTVSDIAADYAHAIEHDLGEPVMLHGTSTGGSVALQLAADAPGLVTRMVVASSAYRLSPHGRHVQSEIARLIAAGDPRRAAAVLMAVLAPRPLRSPARGVGWLAGRVLAPGDSADMLATIEAEDAFDVEARLPDIEAATLVLGGAEDPFYSGELFRGTAARIPRGRAVVFRGKSHTYPAGKVPSAIGLGFLLG
ncbi:alpha/beta fold hydrolase [Mumia zhuanghuii]|uniref:Alpha/beta hydrolase n=1 Tax=Mumia zhuanghuii TaxID=2585211 RepID=A0A5C4MH74_9ACTN|nr:alpha/beta hydrolase [Mumia zhuanghuii]TNC42445.1 alpha/beta hydrolase [Mumia zhuanghuii]TNC43708.1 alpha/beta hydrolase [Mumia zhuanghuii]